MLFNFKKISMTIITVAAVGLLAGLVWLVGVAGPVEAETAATHPHTLTIEMAEDGTRFTPDEGPVFEDGMPAFGSAFVTQGYLYPEGTLTCDGEGNCDGVLPDGSPEFPDAVIGIWTCWGYHIADGARTEAGPIVVTNQMYDFGDVPGAEMITTMGYEMADLNNPVARSITGGTGVFRNATGVQNQELLGLNNADSETFGVSLSITFDLEGVTADTLMLEDDETGSMDADTQ